MSFFSRLFIFVKVMLLYVGLLSTSVNVSAFQVIVLDQDGQLVKDAFVAIPDRLAEASEKEPAVMDQINVNFFPHVLAIGAGDSVIFPNSDNIRHHVYSFSQPKRFEIKLYKGVPKQPIAFEQAGMVALGCNIHDTMLAYIYVSPWADFVVTDEKGIATLPRETDKIAIWHPWENGKTEASIIDVTPQGGVVKVSLNLTKPGAEKNFKNYRRRYND